MFFIGTQCKYGRLKTSRHMSRKAIGHRGNCKVPRHCCCPWGKSSSSGIIEDHLTSARPQKFLEIFEDSAFCRHRMIITITMRLNRHEKRQGTLATSQIEEGICWLARTVWENLLCSS